VKPIIRRNDSASILIVGLFFIKLLIGLAVNSITPTDNMIAIAIIDRCSTSPTAVITESREKTISSTAICASTEKKLVFLETASVE